MSYREPKLQVFQDFEAALAAGTAPLYACIIGPNYELHRFTEDSEKAELGVYDRTASSSTYAWADHVAGGVIDLSTAEIWIEDAMLLYYESVASANVTVTNGNKIRSSVIFKTNSYASRSAAFGERDVQAGDTAILRWLDSSSQQMELQTTVSGFEADVIDGTLDPTVVRVTGFGSTTAASVEDPSTPVPTRIGTAYSVVNYNGLADGYPSDVYTILVTAIGFGTDSGGTLDGTAFRITSAGGDTTKNVVLGGVDAPWSGTYYEVPLGDRGAVLHVTDNGAIYSVAIGNYWRVTISQDYSEVSVDNPAEFDVTGPYSGTKNTQYILTVILGGEVSVDDIVIGYRTNNGADSEGTITIPAADFSGGSSSGSITQNDYPIGIRGMVLTFFKNTQWNTGDIIVFDVLGQSEGAVHTLILRDPVPVSTSVDLDLDLLVVRTFEFPVDFRTLTSDYIVVQGNASYVTDLLGTLESFQIIGGTLYADYRELKTAACNQLGSVASVSSVESVLGPAVAVNPLAKAVMHALENSNSVEVYYLAICSNDLAGYASALDVLTENDEVYGFVPLSNEQDVKDLFRAHVLERSNEINNQWRIAWVANNAARITPVYTELSNGNDILATISEFGTGLYRRVDAASALFQTNSVAAGDSLRINFTTDLEGVTTYDTYTVDRVESETMLVLTSSLPAPISVPVKIEIWRTLSKDQYAQELAENPVHYNSRRVICVWADNPVEDDGTAMEIFYVAAALSGQRSGAAPHAPLSQVSLLGINLDPLIKFSRLQFNTVASGGNWIVTKDYSGNVFTRHQLTSVTNPDDFLQREQSKTTNLDHISRDFYSNTRDLFGQGNISPEMLGLIRQRINSLIEEISNRPYPAKIGPQMLDATILSLHVDPVLRDTVIVEIDPSMPDPLNVMTIRFRVS